MYKVQSAPSLQNIKNNSAWSTEYYEVWAVISTKCSSTWMHSTYNQVHNATVVEVFSLKRTREYKVPNTSTEWSGVWQFTCVLKYTR